MNYWFLMFLLPSPQLPSLPTPILPPQPQLFEDKLNFYGML